MKLKGLLGVQNQSLTLLFQVYTFPLLHICHVEWHFSDHKKTIWQ
uniref:Uncharacterized protein n=1 Tax=Anguilla anguilla TaxID=7936 RepID=A0A0E9SD99_ANGAN